MLLDRRRLKRLLHETVPILIDVVKAAAGTRFLLGLAVEGVLVVTETLPLLGGRGLRWYQDALGKRSDDPVDTLVKLAEHEANKHMRSKVDEVLCRAFLADLQDGFSAGFPRIWNRDENCLALLDADSAAAREFINIIAAQQQDWNPLLIVAASSTRSPSAGHRHPEQWVVPLTSQVRNHYQDWRTRRHMGDSWTTLYPVALGSLTPDEADDFACQVSRDEDDIEVTGIFDSADQAARFAYHLTKGHPDGMRLVLRALSRQRQKMGADNVDVRGLFGWEDQRGNKSWVADETLRLLIGTWSTRLRRTLIRSAAARHFGKKELAPALDGASDEVVDMMTDFWSRDLWVQHHPREGSAPPPTLHQFPRRGVMHLLTTSIRPTDPTWDDVHQLMQACAKECNDTIGEMYHRLARGGGGIHEVSQYLRGLFRNEDTETWYHNLRAITQAPLAHPTQGANAEEHWQLRMDGADDRFVALVAALQIHEDPLGDPHHSLCLVIAQELEALARRWTSGLMILHSAARRFRDCSRKWHTHDASVPESFDGNNLSTGSRGA
jgi:hypothetical protein